MKKILLLISLTLIVAFISNLKLKIHNHYNIDRSSVTWKRLFWNKKILKKFPLYETKSDEEYNYYGYDHTPYSIQVWEISYLSGLPKDSLVKLYLDYFRKKGLSLQKGSIKCGPVETPYPNTEKFGNKSGNCRILAIDSVKENESFVKFSYWNE